MLHVFCWENVICCTFNSFAVASAEAAGMISAAFRTNELTMPLALTPNLKEERVSAALSREGEQQMMRAVFAVPPKESCIPEAYAETS